jgi:hypothetical protein
MARGKKAVEEEEEQEKKSENIERSGNSVEYC